MNNITIYFLHIKFLHIYKIVINSLYFFIYKATNSKIYQYPNTNMIYCIYY